MDSSAPVTGTAMTVGVVAGLVCMPAVGRWLDRGARSTVVAASMLVRVARVALLLATPAGHVWPFAMAALFLGIGNQAWPAAHAALVATVAHGRERDAALAGGRALRNAGLGVGALLATACLAGGTTALQALAAVTGLAHLDAAALVWSAAVLVANTVLVVTLQVPVTVLMSRFSRRTVLLGHDWGAQAVAMVSVVCTIGEIIYAGSATALVTALAPPHAMGRTLARFELSTGFGLAVSPAAITTLAPHGPAALWGSLAAATLVSAAAIATERSEERGSAVATAGREQAHELGNRSQGGSPRVLRTGSPRRNGTAHSPRRPVCDASIGGAKDG